MSDFDFANGLQKEKEIRNLKRQVAELEEIVEDVQNRAHQNTVKLHKQITDLRMKLTMRDNMLEAYRLIFGDVFKMAQEKE